MYVLDISIQTRVVIGISAMVLLFTSFIVAFIANQRKKLEYHKNLNRLQEDQQKALQEQNVLLEQRVADRTIELREQKDALQIALTDLQASQLQLVQKEKMASLGELTAGIAHEMQNPLNFVNNFSEINNDLLADIQQRFAAEKLPENFTNDINPLFRDLSENLSKIFQHGKRADNIVKNMLQHARVQPGNMEHTDINALTEEYIKLAYHGFRSKNKNFTCDITSNFDENAGRINIVPVDIGRVLVNLLNNSFYALKENTRMKGKDFQPAISVQTARHGGRVELIVRDNGIGIPKKFIDKIYQPFFTTKPTGEGTGLGLSLTYDIIKAHRGELKVNSTEGEFAEFIVVLNE